ncbi:N-acetylmuramoyl-L-alanine amidase CwlD [Salinithrix halophila]|uniref:N-acetylmuramoyl-L-alanine amidase CwlD n=1 Tax=Salinithrix halophila TaxID=1485204 RepID=A0ABV8J9B2_9BACL
MEELWREWVREKRGFWRLIGLLLLTATVLCLNGLPWDGSKSTWSMPLTGRLIVIDPGHGGRDGGAVSATGLLEKNVSLAIALSLRDYLQEAGAMVIMTRETDRDLADEHVKSRKSQDLIRRAELVKKSRADAFISIHLNAIPSPRWKGAQTFYYPTLEANKKLAVAIQSELKRNLENTKRLARHSGEVYIMRTSPIPSALVEVGFLSNPEEAEMLRNTSYQKKLAAAIYHGIMLYYSRDVSTPEDSG